MNIPQRSNSKSKDIAKKIIIEAAKETNQELKNCLDELKKLKEEIAAPPYPS